ncbi:MAG TPA: HNH endonuclease signature motif containing protein [Vicinamibacterales bacterium]|nr:HNH endonuclease signature motif containing protein [Vicinamibacterales bacterium]
MKWVTPRRRVWRDRRPPEMTMVYRCMTHERSFADLSDSDLIAEARHLAANERTATAALIACLAELDARRLHLGMGYSSLHDYCAKALRLTDYAGYARIEAARVARRFPLALDLLRDGSINLTTISLLGRHLTAENHGRVLRAAVHKSKREIEIQVAALRPLPDAPAIVRKLPAAPPAVAAPPAPALPAVLSSPLLEEQTAGPLACVVPPRPRQSEAPRVPTRPPAPVTPLAPQRFKVQLTIGQETHDKLRRVQDLLRHCVPSGDPAVIFDRALTLLLRDLERRKLGAVDRARADGTASPDSRHVPASVKRAVWARDGGQCAFVGTEGRCTARGFLELHHVEPFALGGPTTIDNLQLRCRAHNAYEAEMEFGAFVLREKAVGYLDYSTGSGPS